VNTCLVHSATGVKLPISGSFLQLASNGPTNPFGGSSPQNGGGPVSEVVAPAVSVSVPLALALVASPVIVVGGVVPIVTDSLMPLTPVVWPPLALSAVSPVVGRVIVADAPVVAETLPALSLFAGRPSSPHAPSPSHEATIVAEVIRAEGP
jgi:hypothetical protein